MTKYHELARVQSNVEVAAGIFLMSLTAPLIAHAASAGQFVHLCVSGMPKAQVLRMPFCVYDICDDASSVEICYQVLGEGTLQLSRVEPDALIDMLGPLGSGWSIPRTCAHALLVAGGLGAPALNLLARKLVQLDVMVDIVMGAQSADKLVCKSQLNESALASGGKLFITTDDGSLGTHGFVTALSDDLVASGDYDYMAVCGPTLMEAHTVKAALEQGVFCEVSMERLMACGVGICLSCVVDTYDGHKRCCSDGPVFDAAQVVWQ